MKINGADYNFGRVVYLTIGKIAGNPYKYTGSAREKMTNVITIAFDPKTNPQLTTRIDFMIRHQYGEVSNVTGSACSLAAIDIYNIGPVAQQFLNAYNAAENTGRWRSNQVSRYVCALQVGYYGSQRHTIFAGVINSYNIERKQSDKTVDTVWHLYCGGTGGYDIVPLSQSETAVSGEDYSLELIDQNERLQTYVSGEAYIKSIVMEQPRQVYKFVSQGQSLIGSSFSIESLTASDDLVALPEPITITNRNFNKYFEIKYMGFNSGIEEEWTKNVWQQESMKGTLNLDTSDLTKAIQDVAKKRNCYAQIRLDENTGKQIIHIYSQAALKTRMQKRNDFEIKNFQNLRKPPLVSGVSIRFDMILEPRAKPYDTFELTVSEDYIKNAPSFGVSFSQGWGHFSTAFAGANFDGLSNTLTKKSTKQRTEQTGNVFNKKYVAINVMHQGSTHTAEWTTQVDCANVEI